MTINELLNTLTQEQATEYAAVTDKAVWVIDNIIDPNELPNSWLSAIENRLDTLNTTN